MREHSPELGPGGQGGQLDSAGFIAPKCSRTAENPYLQPNRQNGDGETDPELNTAQN